MCEKSNKKNTLSPFAYNMIWVVIGIILILAAIGYIKTCLPPNDYIII